MNCLHDSAASRQSWPPHIGARENNSGASGTDFVVWAPEKVLVKLWYSQDRASQNIPDVRKISQESLEKLGWSTVDLAKNEGYWHVRMANLGQGALYLYQLLAEDGSSLIHPDPGSFSQPFGVHGPSEVVSTDFHWDDHNWQGVNWERLVIYQAHPALFSVDSTLEGIVPRIPYLESLGFTLFYSLPIMQTPGKRNLGYDGAYPRAVAEFLGGLKSAQKMVNELHKAGIAVAFDCHEQNHMGPEGAYLWNFGPYFTSAYDTPWGSAKNNDQPGCAGQRRSLIETIRFYFEILHADVLRMDACHQVYDGSDYHILRELQDEVDRLSAKLGRPVYLLGETDADDGFLISPREQGGCGWRGQLYDGLHHAVRAFLLPESEGYFRDYIVNGKYPLEKLAEILSSGYRRHYSLHHQMMWGKDLPEEIPVNSLVLPTSNHDQAANFGGRRLATLMDFETMKAYMALGLLLPNPPFVFFGDEFACKTPFHFFTDFEDPGVIEGVRKGRLEEFRYFSEVVADFPDPQSLKTFEMSRPDFENFDQEESAMLDLVRHCIRLRGKFPAILQNSRAGQRVFAFEGLPVLAYERVFDDQSVVLLLNLGDKESLVEFACQGRGYQVALDTSSSLWRGPSGNPVTFANSNVFGVRAHSLVLLVGRVSSV
jgi:maltooligosyltrehalose trehalohydrolase